MAQASSKLSPLNYWHKYLDTKYTNNWIGHGSTRSRPDVCTTIHMTEQSIIILELVRLNLIDDTLHIIKSVNTIEQMKCMVSISLTNGKPT